MFRYKIKIEYCGSSISGWQKQSHALSIQGCIEQAILDLTKENPTVVGSGRTDAGVHALAQCAHFDLNKNISSKDLIRGINHFLKPNLIVILDCKIVDKDFHARFSAKSRTYKYFILNRLYPSVLDKERCWHVKMKLNIDSIIKASQYLVGNHDFTSFRAANCQAQSPIRTIDYIKISIIDEKICFEIKAKSFLYHMVRNIVGTLVEVGLDKIKPEMMINIINAKNRSSAGPTAPAHGLYFADVEY